MAILIANDGDKIVATIAERNALTKKFEGMEVTVLDAIADPIVGSGEAGYIWSTVRNDWLLTWKTSKDNLTFTKESKVLSGGSVAANFTPQDGIVWGAVILDAEGHILADVTPTVTGSVISIGSTSFDGSTLQYYYGYGTIAAAIGQISKAYDIGGGVGGKPSTSDLILMAACVRSLTIPENLSGSIAKCLVAPTTTQALPLKKNGTQVATVTINAGQTTGTLSNQVAINCVAGDLLTIPAPSTQDSTFADIFITIKVDL